MNKILLSSLLFVLLDGAPRLAGCSCVAYPKPFCSRDLDAVDPSQTVVFVGRATKAPNGFRAARSSMREGGQAALQAALAAGIAVRPSREGQGSPEVEGAIVEAMKRNYVALYADRLPADQLSRLQEVESLEGLSELGAALSQLGRAVEFDVVEALIGDLPQTIEIFTGRGGGDCGFDFQEGETYMVEAHRNEQGELHSWMCSGRVSMIDDAGEDLRTVRAWKQGSPLAPRIYGTVQDWTTRGDTHRTPFPPAAGVRLTISDGERTEEAVRAEDGSFQFNDLVPTEHSLQVTMPGWKMTRVSDGQRPIDLSTTGCAALSVLIEEEQGAISGRVLPQAGESLPEYLWVEAIPAGDDGIKPFDGTARSPDGNFTIEKIEPGDYFVSINVENTPSGPHHSAARNGRVWPYPPTYYPGVSDRQSAAVFHIDRGTKVVLPDWTLPARLSERRLAGKAVLPDGSPAPDTRAVIRRPDLSERAGRSGPTGADGTFEVWPLESLSYVLEAASFHPKDKVVYKGDIEITPATEGPLLLQLHPTDEDPSDPRFFSPYEWKTDR